MDYWAEVKRLEALLPYCLENKRRRREFVRGVKSLPHSSPHWLLLEGYRLALSGHSERARERFLSGYFQCTDEDLKQRFHWAAVSLERAYPRPQDLDEVCQWLSAALHDGPAQELAMTGLPGPAREMAALADWLRNPILEGRSLRQGLEECLSAYPNVCLELERAPAPLEQLFYRVFQEVAEARAALQPERVCLRVRTVRKGWLASWDDEIGRACQLPTWRARVAQLSGRARMRTDPGFQVQVLCPRWAGATYS